MKLPSLSCLPPYLAGPYLSRSIESNEVIGMAISTYIQERRRINTNTMECTFHQFA